MTRKWKLKNNIKEKRQALGLTQAELALIVLGGSLLLCLPLDVNWRFKDVHI